MNDLSRVLVTGATGFIGSHLTRRLLQEGFKVAIINREKSNVWRIKDLLNKVVTYEVDLQDTDGISKTFSHFRPNVVFHLATYYAVENQSEEVSLMINTNVLGTINLLEGAKDTGIKLFVNTSSCFVYKESENKLKEDGALNPLNLYALTKLQAEEACNFYAAKYRVKIVTFRLFPPYGPADHERRLIPYVIRSLLKKERLKMTTGKQKWDFIYVDDIVDAYFKLLLISNFSQKHEILNIGTGSAISVREVVLRIQNIIGSDIEPEWGTIPHRKNEVWFTCADISKTEHFLKWKPSIQINDEGLELTIKWYKNFWKGGGHEK